MTLLTDPPLVVGTVKPDGLEDLAALPAHERVADLIEARFDLAIDPNAARAEPPFVAPDLGRFFPACLRLAQTGTPVLATIRLVADGGRWTEDAARLPLFQAAMSTGGCAWVDIEVGSTIAAEVVRSARQEGRRVVVSHHDFEGTGDPRDLDGVVDRAQRLGADIVKIATRVDDLEDHDTLLDLLRRRRGQALAVIGMGAAGRSLRSYLPAVGSRLTYGFMDEAVAPGQLSATELVLRLMADCPAYAAYRQERTR